MFPRFTIFIGALACESMVLAISLTYSHDLYGNIWIVSRGLVLALELLAVVEIFTRSADHFHGIETIGRKLFWTLLAGALIIAFLTMKADRKWQGWLFAYEITTVINRQLHLFFAAFLLLMLAFFAYYGAPVAPNLRRHSWAMCSFLTATALTYLIATRQHALWLTNIVLQTVSCLCFAAWLTAFRPGENTRAALSVSPAEIQEMGAAEELNGKLVEFSRRIKLRSLLGFGKPAPPSGD